MSDPTPRAVQLHEMQHCAHQLTEVIRSAVDKNRHAMDWYGTGDNALIRVAIGASRYFTQIDPAFDVPEFFDACGINSINKDAEELYNLLNEGQEP